MESHEFNHFIGSYAIFNLRFGTKEKFRNKEATKWEIYLIRFKENLINVKMYPSSIVEVNRLATDLKEAIVEAFHFACPEKTIRLLFIKERILLGGLRN